MHAGFKLNPPPPQEWPLLKSFNVVSKFPISVFTSPGTQYAYTILIPDEPSSQGVLC